jgi:hypothetical protein
MKITLHPAEHGDRRFTVDKPPVTGALITVRDDSNYQGLVIADSPRKEEEEFGFAEGGVVTEDGIRELVENDRQAEALVRGFVQRHFGTTTAPQ